jgi:hypothetical protein
MTSRARRLPRSAALLALVLAASPGLLGTQCAQRPPRPVHEAATLYLLAKPLLSTFQFPAPATTDGIVQEVQHYYLEASYGTELLRGADVPLPGGDVLGPFQTSDWPLCGAEDLYVVNLIRSVHAGVDVTRYQHVVVIAPDEGCSFNGFDFPPELVNLGGQLVWVDFVFINAISLYYGGGGTQGAGLIVHELGHQYGLVHSGGLQCPYGTVRDAGCNEAEYLDLIDTMGASIFRAHFNAFHKKNLGWIEPGDVTRVTESGLYVLTPFETTAPGPKALEIPRQDDSSLFVEYRTPTGYDDISVPGFTDGAVVHVSRPLYTGGPLFPYVLQGPTGAYALQPGDVFTDARGHRIEVLAKNPDGILLDVEFVPHAEGTPPTLIASTTTGSGPGLVGVRVQASDGSGIARVEIYTRRYAAHRYDWTALSLLAAHDAPGSPAAVDVRIDVPAASIADDLEVAAYDDLGNVARVQAF